jgi:DNA-binding response OmpR family regulator
MSKKVLIVGDTPRWLEAVKTAFPKHTEVHVATDFIGALCTLFNIEPQLEPHFDLYIVGNKLPDMQDGIRLLTEIREDGRNEPFIIFSDHVEVV